jgi:hypothetical protein
MATPRKSKPVTPTPAPAAPAKVAPAVPAAPIERSEVKGSGSPKAAPAAAPRVITHDQIARRAYEIYASRGYAAGDQNADWLEAERQLKAGL